MVKKQPLQPTPFSHSKNKVLKARREHSHLLHCILFKPNCYQGKGNTKAYNHYLFTEPYRAPHTYVTYVRTHIVLQVQLLTLNALPQCYFARCLPTMFELLMEYMYNINVDLNCMLYST